MGSKSNGWLQYMACYKNGNELWESDISRMSTKKDTDRWDGTGFKSSFEGTKGYTIRQMNTGVKSCKKMGIFGITPNC